MNRRTGELWVCLIFSVLLNTYWLFESAEMNASVSKANQKVAELTVEVRRLELEISETSQCLIDGILKPKQINF